MAKASKVSLSKVAQANEVSVAQCDKTSAKGGYGKHINLPKVAKASIISVAQVGNGKYSKCCIRWLRKYNKSCPKW